MVRPRGAQPQLSLQLFRCRAGLSLGVASVFTLREHPVSAREMAGISARPLLQIILVLRLCFPEVTHGLDFGDDLAVPQSGRVDVGDRLLGDPFLLLIDIVDA